MRFGIMDLSICLDIGHVLVGYSGPVGLDDALEACLPRLGDAHLHDGSWQGEQREIGYGQDHRPPGAGDLDTGRLPDRPTEAGFAGLVILELTVEEVHASLDHFRALRPALVG